MTFNGNSLTVGGLQSNSGACSTIAGGFANSIGSGMGKSFIGGGCGNSLSTTANCSVIGGGKSNSAVNQYDQILGGKNNKICVNAYCAIDPSVVGCNAIVGNSNVINTGFGANVIIGFNNSICGNAYGGTSRIIGAINSCINDTYGGGGHIFGGSCHSLNAGYGSGGTIVGGFQNTMNGYHGFPIILGGRCNTTDSGVYCSAIVGGGNNLMQGNRSAIIGGCTNTNNKNCSIMLGLAGRTACTDNTTHVNCLNIQSTCGGTTGAKQVSILPGITSNGSVVTDMCEMCVAYNATQIQGVLGNGPNCVIIAAPGANKTLIIYEAIFQIQTSGTNTTQGFNGAFQVVSPSYNCNNTNINNTVAALIPANVLQASVRNGQTYTTYQRDAPTDGRIYSTNQCVRFGWSNSNPYPNGFPSVFTCLRTRLRYKIYCDTAF